MPFADLASLLNYFFQLTIITAEMDSLRLLQNQFIYLFDGYSLILISMVVIVNRSNLNRLNIDKYFVAVILCGGLSYDWDPSWQLGLATALASFFVFILCGKGWLIFSSAEPNLTRVFLVILLGFLLGLLLMGNPINFMKFRWVIQWFLFFIPFVVAEEVMFRGMLWSFLKDLNFSVFWIVTSQAILFWLSHVHFANNLVFFWVITPVVSVLLGIIVWRYRSITLSATAHMLVNLLLGLVASRNS
jgi:membrane protease YdiL (CAAX protease family)